MPLRDDLAERLADEPLRAGEAGPLGVRRVAEQEVDAAVADLGELADVGLKPSTGVWSSFQSLVCRTRPASVSITTATLSGTECAMRTNSSRNGPISTGPPSGSTSRSSAARSRPCSSSFDLTSPSVSRVAQTSRHPHLAQEVRQRADVVLVRVRQHDGADLARPVAQVGEVRAARGRRRGARRAGTRGPASTTTTRPLVLEHGHVLADLAEPAERNDAKDCDLAPEKCIPGRRSPRTASRRP